MPIGLTDLTIRKHKELIEFIVNVLNKFASNVDGNYEWGDYFTEEDIEKWIIETEKLTDDFYVDGSKIEKELPF